MPSRGCLNVDLSKQTVTNKPVSRSRETRCRLGGRCRTLVGVFQFAVFVARALDRAAMTAASALLSSAGLLALDGVRL
jgi:hypothetical protein